MNNILAIPVFLPVLAGAVLLFCRFKDKEDIHIFSLIVMGITVVATLIANFLLMSNEITLFELPMGLVFTLYTDAVAAFFSTIFVIVWFVVAFYSIEYLKHEGKDKRFFGYYLMTLGCLVGVAYADNPFTLYLCFEAMTFASFALVLHSQTKESINAAKKYIYYSVFGAFCGLIGVIYFYAWDKIEVKSFLSGGVVPHELGGAMPMLMIVTLISIIGFSCKCGLFPLHAWLPVAHPEAPAPASSVLSGVITKSGIIAIVRIVFFVVGADILRDSSVQYVLLILSIVTIFMGSMMAYKEKNLKRRLAYSSISQISYVLFGIMLLTEVGAVGAMLQVAFHAVAKNVLFLAAGSIIYSTHKTQVSQLDGLGKVMPKTFTYFTIASLSLVGVPFTAGFVSKFYLAQGAFVSNFDKLSFFGFIVLMISALLTGGYLLVITAKALFAKKDVENLPAVTESKLMTVPMGILSVCILLFGIWPTPVIQLAQAVAHSFGL